MPGAIARFGELSVQYSAGYIDSVFTTWYSMGKPSPTRLMAAISPYEENGIAYEPSQQTIRRWINEIFLERAKILDDQVMNQINQRLIAEKVEMLNRHANMGSYIQDMALKYLKEHADDLNVANSVRLLVEGVRIERESRGISTTIEKITGLSDEELEKQVRQLVERSPVDLIPMEIEDADNESEQEVDS